MGCDKGCRCIEVWKSLEEESARFRLFDALGGPFGGGDVESDGPGEWSPSPVIPEPYECRSPVEIEFSRVFNLSANSLM